MYNGIGLATARGSGTNAYVQKNLSFTNRVKQKVEYKTEEDIRKLEATVNRPANQAILAHQRKRQIELKCLEMREKMEEQGYAEDEIDAKVASYREVLVAKAEESARMKEMLFKFDDNGRPFVKETHQMAEVNQERNDKLKRALGISETFVEGSSLSGVRKVKEAVEKTDETETGTSQQLSPKVAVKSVSVKVNDGKDMKLDKKDKSEKAKEKRVEDRKRDSEAGALTKEIPKKYSQDERNHAKSKRSRSGSRSRDCHVSRKNVSRKKSHYSGRSKRGHRDSDTSSSSRERDSRRSKIMSRSSPSSSSYSSDSSSSSQSSSRVSHSSPSSSRSPPIRRRRGSPSFREKRRITSARKRPVPYRRRSPSSGTDSSLSMNSDDSSFSSMSTVSRKRYDWRCSSHTSTSNSFTDIT